MLLFGKRAYRSRRGFGEQSDRNLPSRKLPRVFIQSFAVLELQALLLPQRGKLFAVLSKQPEWIRVKAGWVVS